MFFVVMIVHTNSILWSAGRQVMTTQICDDHNWYLIKGQGDGHVAHFGHHPSAHGCPVAISTASGPDTRPTDMSLMNLNDSPRRVLAER